MGVIDQAIHTLTCQCGNVESVTILQYGSAYGASWQDGKAFSGFDATWGKDGPTGPTVSEAKCKKCGGAPKVSVS